MNANGGPSRYRRGLWVLWVVGLAAWTILLVTPGQVFAPMGTQILSWSKVAHGGVYAAFATATFLLPVGANARAWLLAGLVAHGGLTEFLQTLVPNRHGSALDVGYDTAGVLAGLLCGWVWGRYGCRGAGDAAPPQGDQGAGREDEDADVLRHR
jgi:VanZ family protein